jgi:uncharacterized protein (DUF885 family)
MTSVRSDGPPVSPAVTDELCQSYLDLKWHFDPAAGSEAGVPDQDGRLGSFDVESVREHLAAFQSLAMAVEDLAVEDLQDEIDRTALLDEIRVTRFRFESERPHTRNPAFWLGHVFDALYHLLIRTDHDPAHRAAAALSRLEALPDFLAMAEATLEEPPSVFLDAAVAMLPGGEDLIARTAGTLGGEVPEQAEALRLAAAGATSALTVFGDALRTDLAIHPDEMAFAVGEDQFEHRLHLEHALRQTAPELWRYGLRLEEEVTARLTELAGDMAPGTHWRDLIENLRDDTLPGGELLEAYREELTRARRLTAECDLATIPDGPLSVVATPEFMRPLIPIAAYQPPGPLMSNRTGYFYVSVPDSGEPDEVQAQLRDHCRHELPTIAVHEAYPGHHLQILTAHRQRSLVRRFVWSPVTVEGWALYCEELMSEQGFYRTPEASLFQLAMLLWRAVRIVLDVGLHTRGMTPGAAVDYLLERLPMNRSAAEAEVRRYCAMPTYQLCYAVGRRDILALREACRERDGEAFRLRTFHDDLMSYGGLPVSLARWGMGLNP